MCCFILATWEPRKSQIGRAAYEAFTTVGTLKEQGRILIRSYLAKLPSASPLCIWNYRRWLTIGKDHKDVYAQHKIPCGH